MLQVLKPQREGGGYNSYGAAVAEARKAVLPEMAARPSLFCKQNRLPSQMRQPTHPFPVLPSSPPRDRLLFFLQALSGGERDPALADQILMQRIMPAAQPQWLLRAGK